MSASSNDPPAGKDPALTETRRWRRLLGRTTPQSNEVSPLQTDGLQTLDEGLDQTRTGLLAKIGLAFKGNLALDDEVFEQLEDALISSDIGVDASLELIERLRTRVKLEKIQDPEGVVAGLQSEMAALLKTAEQPWPALTPAADAPLYVMVVVGVNGVGKTTTIAKLASRLQQQGLRVMLAAADTFRAAAVEQLQEWGERLDMPVIAQQHGADAAAVAHDAVSAAIARNADVLIIDTAGRLHTQGELMEQLQKVIRVVGKINSTYPHEVMQILDATTGQNAITQLTHFHQAVNVSSLCITKLDGSAKGGMVLGLTAKLGLPIRYLGTGEGFDDLQPFSAVGFATALLADFAPDA